MKIIGIAIDFYLINRKYKYKNSETSIVEPGICLQTPCLCNEKVQEGEMALSCSFVRVCVLGCGETDVCKEKQRDVLITCAGKSCWNRAFRSHFSQKSVLVRNEEVFLSKYFKRARTSLSPCN